MKLESWFGLSALRHAGPVPPELEGVEQTWVELYTIEQADNGVWGLSVLWRGPMVRREEENFEINMVLFMSLCSLCRSLNAFYRWHHVQVSVRCVTGIPAEHPRWIAFNPHDLDALSFGQQAPPGVIE